MVTRRAPPTEVCGLSTATVGAEGCVNSYSLACAGLGSRGYTAESTARYVGTEEHLRLQVLYRGCGLRPSCYLSECGV